MNQKLPSLPLAVERVVERSNDRVSQTGDKYTIRQTEQLSSL
jgi:hypothetical protein